MTGTVVLRPLKDLNINTEFTFNPYSWSETNTNRLVTQYKADGTTFLYPHTNPNGVQEQNSNDYYTALNIYADYTKSFSRHNFKVMLGYNQEIKTHKWAQAIRKGLIDNDFPILNLATGEQTVNGDQSSWAVQGVFGRINYDLMRDICLKSAAVMMALPNLPVENGLLCFLLSLLPGVLEKKISCRISRS